MNKLSKGVSSLLIFALLFGLFYTSYTGLTEANGYNITVNGTDTELIEGFDNLGIVSGVNETLIGVYIMGNPTASAFDIIGALASSAIGIVKNIGDLLIFPLQIGTLLGKAYNIPPIFINSILVIIGTMVGFLVLSAYLGRDI